MIYEAFQVLVRNEASIVLMHNVHLEGLRKGATE